MQVASIGKTLFEPLDQKGMKREEILCIAESSIDVISLKSNENHFLNLCIFGHSFAHTLYDFSGHLISTIQTISDFQVVLVL